MIFTKFCSKIWGIGKTYTVEKNILLSGYWNTFWTASGKNIPLIGNYHMIFAPIGKKYTIFKRIFRMPCCLEMNIRFDWKRIYHSINVWINTYISWKKIYSWLEIPILLMRQLEKHILLIGKSNTTYETIGILHMIQLEKNIR